MIQEPDLLDSPVLRRRPGVRLALRRALREALREAERNASADPMELLAYRLLRRGGAATDSVQGPETPRPSAAVAVAPEGPTQAVGVGDGVAPVTPDGADPCRGRGGRLRRRCAGGRNGTRAYPPLAARRHGLPPKLPTAAMWPPLRAPAGAPGDASAYRSLGRVQPYRGGDLEQPGELRRAAAARAFGGELILTYGNEAGTAWIANLVFSLRAAGRPPSPSPFPRRPCPPPSPSLPRRLPRRTQRGQSGPTRAQSRA